MGNPLRNFGRGGGMTGFGPFLAPPAGGLQNFLLQSKRGGVLAGNQRPETPD
jgi:hypothetical protein